MLISSLQPSLPPLGRRSRVVEPDVESFVDPALVLGPDDREAPHRRRRVDVRAAARLRVEALDLDHADAPAGDRRPGLERAEQITARAALILREGTRRPRTTP